MSERITVFADTLLKLVNSIIAEAIEHGGDSGGAYYNNAEGLRDKMTCLLRWCGLQDEFVIVDLNMDGNDELRFAKLANNGEDKP